MRTNSTETTYRLVAPEAATPVPVLDEFQRRVVDHPGGPLLVLAGPGTGKTTTLVEAIVDRIDNRGADPESVLALTFSRKAAEQLRDRVTARLGRTTASALSSTFHSFAYALIRSHAPAELYEAPLKLLSAPEQDVVLQELLTDAPESVAWPEGLRRAVTTRGFAREVHAVLARAREKGPDGTDLRELGIAEGMPEFVAAGLFLDQYLQVLDFQGAIDYPDLIRRAVTEAERHRDELRARFQHVFVDEYQDTDPGQVALLRALAGDGGNLTVVGDPHQSIYGFRGAEVRGILEFPTEFPQRSAAPAEVVALRTTRRFGPHLLLASQRVARRLSLAGTIPEEAREAFLDPVAAGDDVGNGRVEVLTFDTERAETEHLADRLRRAHLSEGVAWSRMAVLVRSGRNSIPALRRSLGAAGVPVEVASDDTPLVREVAVMPLLDALRAVVHLDEDDPAAPGHLDPDRAHDLLTSPLAGLDASDVRALARALRARDKARVAESGGTPRPSPELLREAVVVPEVLADLDLPAVRRARALGDLLRRARQVLEEGGSAEEVLWELWSGTDWPRRLRAQVDNGGASARRAHRDLDAICALFATAAKAEERRGHTGVAAFLAGLQAQDLPGDTLADRGVRGDAVRLLTAHRAKGLEWDLVVVAHVQEEGWPDLRRRATLLQADRIGEDGVVPPVSLREQLMEERRLFYVACTRARSRLLVTAVRSPDDDGEQPSRFLAELLPSTDGEQADRGPVHVQGRPKRPLSLAGMVAELRHTVADPDTPDQLRAAAARRLVRLSRERVGERPLVPAADPANWWGTRAASISDVPVRPEEKPVSLSASALTSIEECPARWFLEREAGGATAATSAQGFGLLVHALAERVASGELSADPDDIDVLMEQVDRVWDRLAFRTPWSSTREREEMRQALARYLVWHAADRGRTLVATEKELTARVSLPDGQRVTLHGFADRLEVDADGEVVVIDFKTGKYKPTGEEVKVHPQLGLYQLAVENGAVDDLVEQPPARVGGAELVQLRHGANGKVNIQWQGAQPTDDDGIRPIEEQLMNAATLIREERFPARAGKHCERCSFTAICPIQGAGTVLQ